MFSPLILLKHLLTESVVKQHTNATVNDNVET
jgi:hypothetical protein